MHLQKGYEYEYISKQSWAWRQSLASTRHWSELSRPPPKKMYWHANSPSLLWTDGDSDFSILQCSCALARKLAATLLLNKMFKSSDAGLCNINCHGSRNRLSVNGRCVCWCVKESMLIVDAVFHRNPLETLHLDFKLQYSKLTAQIWKNSLYV